MNTRFQRWFRTMSCAVTLAGSAYGQAPAPVNAPAAGQSAPLTLTLQDALARAQVNGPQLLSALSDASQAREDILQARAAQRPNVSFKSDYLGTQGNGVLPSGRFVTNDGVHVYREWALVHQDFMAALTKTGPQRAAAAETLAQARAEITRRALAGTVTKSYYPLLTGP